MKDSTFLGGSQQQWKAGFPVNKKLKEGI